MKLAWLTLLLPSLASAGEINCWVHERYSRMQITWNETTVTAQVENPSGFAGMPQFEMPISLDSIPMMKLQSERLAGLGEKFSYQWERKLCEFSKEDPWLVSCHGPSQSVGGENGVKALLFTTARIEESSLTGKQSTLRLRFIFGKDGGMHFAALPFPVPSCALHK